MDEVTKKELVDSSEEKSFTELRLNSFHAGLAKQIADLPEEELIKKGAEVVDSILLRLCVETVSIQKEEVEVRGLIRLAFPESSEKLQAAMTKTLLPSLCDLVAARAQTAKALTHCFTTFSPESSKAQNPWDGLDLTQISPYPKQVFQVIRDLCHYATPATNPPLKNKRKGKENSSSEDLAKAPKKHEKETTQSTPTPNEDLDRFRE